ncbi:MAG: hypothetical protein JWO13_118 [Acidobacteriales bacterium]|nr:hypothetical protein [Terriglobales bacterium]
MLRSGEKDRQGTATANLSQRPRKSPIFCHFKHNRFPKWSRFSYLSANECRSDIARSHAILPHSLEGPRAQQTDPISTQL